MPILGILAGVRVIVTGVNSLNLLAVRSIAIVQAILTGDNPCGFHFDPCLRVCGKILSDR